MSPLIKFESSFVVMDITQSLVVRLQGLNILQQGWSAGREKRKQHSLNYEPWLSFPEYQVLAGCDRKLNVSEIPVITQPFLFLRPRVRVKVLSTSPLLDIARSSNRRVLSFPEYNFE